MQVASSQRTLIRESGSIHPNHNIVWFGSTLTCFRRPTMIRIEAQSAVVVSSTFLPGMRSRNLAPKSRSSIPSINLIHVAIVYKNCSSSDVAASDTILVASSQFERTGCHPNESETRVHTLVNDSITPDSCPAQCAFHEAEASNPYATYQDLHG